MKKLVFLLLIALSYTSCSTSQKYVSGNHKQGKSDSNIEVSTTMNSSLFDASVLNLEAVDVMPINLELLKEIPLTPYSQASRIVDYAFAFDGVKYKRGGTTFDGMDCSGLVVTAFDSEKISLPRVSRDIAKTGNKVELNQVDKGDLLFFATRRNSRTISHVGIVTTARDGFVEFIHASTSNGVIVSNMAEKYWYFAFIEARRII